MSDTRPVWTIIQNTADDEGAELKKAVEGQAPNTNHVGSIISKDSQGNYELIQMRDEGDAVAGSEIPVLPAKDGSGNLQHVAVRPQGASATGVVALPSLVAKDASGNLAYVNLNSEGEVLVSSQSNGDPISSNGTGTPGSLNTKTLVTDITLTASKSYETIEFYGSSSAPAVRWELVQINDATTTVRARAITGSGDFSFQQLFGNLVITAGATGTQKLELNAYQLQGNLSDMHGYVGAFQKA